MRNEAAAGGGGISGRAVPTCCYCRRTERPGGGGREMLSVRVALAATPNAKDACLMALRTLIPPKKVRCARGRGSCGPHESKRRGGVGGIF